MPAHARTDVDPLLSPGELAALLRVDPKTVTRCARAGKLIVIRTPDGHRRYREVQIRALLAAVPPPRAAAE